MLYRYDFKSQILKAHLLQDLDCHQKFEQREALLFPLQQEVQLEVEN